MRVWMINWTAVTSCLKAYWYLTLDDMLQLYICIYLGYSSKHVCHAVLFGFSGKAAIRAYSFKGQLHQVCLQVLGSKKVV